MKKFISIIALIISVARLNAQTTTPRWGTGANNDNTFRAMTFAYKSVTDAAGLDTVKLVPNAYLTHVTIPNLVDSVALNVTSSAKSYLGDKIVVTVINSSTGKCVKWAGANLVPQTIATIGGGGAQLYISASQRGTISFIFDGVKWIEQGRVAK